MIFSLNFILTQKIYFIILTEYRWINHRRSIVKIYLSLRSEFRTILTILTTIAPPNAGKNPVITKPLSNAEVIPKIAALITNVNNPKERIFSGRVNIIKIGFIETLSKPKIIDAINKSLSSLNIMPEKIRLAAPSDKEFINHLITALLNKTTSGKLLKQLLKNQYYI